MTNMELFFALVFWHALADFPLQGDYLAKGKNLTINRNWVFPMTAHCVIHGGGVAFLTGSLILGLCEFIIHFVIDTLRCKGMMSFEVDQVFHVWCKAMWVLAIIWGLV